MQHKRKAFFQVSFHEGKNMTTITEEDAEYF
jgi:hypothetical protein